MPSPPSAHDARAVLAALLSRVARSLRQAGLPAVVRRVLPRIDGTAAVELDALTLDWVSPAAPVLDAAPPPPRLHWGRLDGNGAPAATVHAVGQALGITARHPAFRLLPFTNRDRAQLAFGDAVVDVLLADRLAPGRTRWFDWVFTEAFQDRAERFFLHFEGPAGRLRLMVTAPQVEPEGELLVSHPLFRLPLAEDPRPASLRAQVPHQVERFVGFLLHRAVHPAMRLSQSARVTYDGAPEATPGKVAWVGAPISTSRWGNPRQWHQFFSDFEVERAGLCSLRYTDPVTQITHGEPECHRVEPRVRPRPHVFARLPFAAAYHAESPEPGTRHFVSVIGERETVLGSDASLRRVFDAARDHQGTILVVVNNTCLPKMVGDDLDSLVQELRRTAGRPVLRMNTDLDSPEATYRDLVLQTAPGESPGEAGAEDAVALMGFVPGRGRDELVGRLEELGVTVEGVLGPELSAKRAQACRRAAVQVVFPRSPWPGLREALFGQSPSRVLSPPAPFGWTDSLAWLEAVAEATGTREQLAARRLEWQASLGRDFDRLRQQAAALRVGIVVEQADRSRLWEPERCHGVRLLPLLLDCGFQVRVLLLSEGGARDEAEAGADAEAELRAAGGNPEADRLEVVPFESPGELEAHLSCGELQLVYSEVACDARLSRAGIAPLGLDPLELGLAGAVRCLSRWVHRGRWPFYRRYGAYLPPRPERGRADASPAKEPHGS